MPQTKGTWVGKIGFRYFLRSERPFRWRAGFDKSWAWWYLSRKQKQVLAEERRKGRFGGKTGKVPYLWQQERGSELAHIRGQYFLQRAVGHLLKSQGEIIGRHLHR